MNSRNDQLCRLLDARFGVGGRPSFLSVPGRVNLIGEHVDYHNLPVLPMAIRRHISIAFRPAKDPRIRAISNGYPDCDFDPGSPLAPGPPGDWTNYVKAAAQATVSRWPIEKGIEAAVDSDLPAAAGLSSSSALLVGFTLALLRANGIQPPLDHLMQILPEAEHFVGTRGGGMDHAAVLASHSGCATLINFDPITVAPVPLPAGWSFLIAHSLTRAEKSAGIRNAYNARRQGGLQALHKLGFPSFRCALERHSPSSLVKQAQAAHQQGDLSIEEFGPFRHVVEETRRVLEAISALTNGNEMKFGGLLLESHVSLRDWLQVSTPELDRIVDIAMNAGALGARLTGAGFGGCAIVFCRESNRDRVAQVLIEQFYASYRNFNPAEHLIVAEPSAGALVDPQ